MGDVDRRCLGIRECTISNSIERYLPPNQPRYHLEHVVPVEVEEAYIITKLNPFQLSGIVAGSQGVSTDRQVSAGNLPSGSVIHGCRLEWPRGSTEV